MPYVMSRIIIPGSTFVIYGSADSIYIAAHYVILLLYDRLVQIMPTIPMTIDFFCCGQVVNSAFTRQALTKMERPF